MYKTDPNVVKSKDTLSENSSDKKIAALESKINSLSEKLSRVLAENEQLKRSIKRNAQDIQLLTSAIAKK